MAIKTEAPPPGSLTPNVEGDPPSVIVEFTGYAAQQAVDGAALARMSTGDFVVDAVIAIAGMTRWESLGYHVIARDRLGYEFDVTPAVSGIQPPRVQAMTRVTRRAEGDPPSVIVEFTGYAAQQAVDGAALARMSTGDFVVDAVIAIAGMTRWESLGYHHRMVARDRLGREFDLTPAVLGIGPPPVLWE